MTYSLAITGFNGASSSNVKSLTLADANATQGSQALAAQNGTVFLAKGPDGGQALYRLDPYRSTPGNPVLIACKP